MSGEASSTYLRQLADGLVLRRGRPEDAGPLAEFNARIHGAEQGPDERVAVWTRDLLNGHPTFTPGDFLVVEDTHSGKIVSSMNHISQTWRMGAVTFGVGRPELVGTDPAYRNRGLVRAQFEVAHRWSVERGELLQAITGIPYYYRQFGYEMAVELDGGRSGYAGSLPVLPDGQQEPYRLRPVRPDELEQVAAWHAAGCRRSLLSCEMDERLWRYELLGKSPQSVARRELAMIEDAASGEAVGFIGYPNLFWWFDTGLVALNYELKAGVPWAAVTPSVLRFLWQVGVRVGQASGQPCTTIGLLLQSDHPAFSVSEHWLPVRREPYAWYVRLADIPGFLRLITPLLETRLASSPWSGYTGVLNISFYRSGVALHFDAGRITVQDWRPLLCEEGDVAFPDLTFLQLLFGYRSLAELEYAFADCWATARFRPLMTALFPRQNSEIWPVS